MEKKTYISKGADIQNKERNSSKSSSNCSENEEGGVFFDFSTSGMTTLDILRNAIACCLSCSQMRRLTSILLLCFQYRDTDSIRHVQPSSTQRLETGENTYLCQKREKNKFRVKSYLLLCVTLKPHYKSRTLQESASEKSNTGRAAPVLHCFTWIVL